MMRDTMKKIIAFCFAAILAALADTVAFSNSIAGPAVGLSGFTFGYTFTLSNTVSVTKLGFYDYNGDGLINATPVTIWNSSGVQQASATLPAGMDTLVNGYIYATLAAPVCPTAGT